MQTITKKKKQPLNKLLLGAGLLGGGALSYGAGNTMLSNTDADSLSKFIDTAKGQWLNGGDFRQNTSQYAQLGHKAMAAKPFGVDGPDLMLAARSPQLINPLAEYSSFFKNNREKFVVAPGSDEHYRSFAKSPLDGYLALQKELVNNSQPGATWGIDALRAGLKGPHLGKLSPEKARQLANQIGVPTHVQSRIGATAGLDKATSSLNSLINDTQTSPVNHLFHNLPGKFDQAYYDKMTGHVNTLAAQQRLNLASATSAQKGELFNKLDGYIRQSDPDFWKQKQYSDWAMGRSITDAGNTYSGFANILLQPSNLLKYTGVAAAATGVGIGGYQLYKMLKTHLAKKKAVQEQSNVLK